MGVFDIIVRYREAFLGGLRVTLSLALLTWGVGLLAGILLGALGHRYRFLFGGPLRLFAFFLSGIPFLVLLYWANFPLQVLLNVVIDPFYTAVLILVVLNTVGVAEICRIALDDFPEQYLLSAQVCGLTSRQTIFHIQIPLILRQILPGLLNLQVIMLQMTLFASLISVEELFRVAQRINATIYKPVEIYSALAIFFLLICLPVNGLAIWLKYRFTRNLSEK